MHDSGRVVTIGSNTAVRTGSQGSSAYAMTKAAVATMVKGIALDLAPRQITVNNVQPGPTETDLTAAMVTRLREVIPVGRMGQPDEIAALVSYLAGPEAGHMTGASLTIDGGFVLYVPARARHPGSASSSLKKAPFGPSAGSIANSTTARAPRSTVRVPMWPLRSVATCPGVTLLMRKCRCAALRASAFALCWVIISTMVLDEA